MTSSDARVHQRPTPAARHAAAPVEKTRRAIDGRILVQCGVAEFGGRSELEFGVRSADFGVRSDFGVRNCLHPWTVSTLSSVPHSAFRTPHSEFQFAFRTPNSELSEFHLRYLLCGRRRFKQLVLLEAEHLCRDVRGELTAGVLYAWTGSL